MSTSKSRVFVLVGDEQTPLSPQDVADSVMSEGFKTTSMRYGFSVSTLRKFLKENKVKIGSKRIVIYERAVPQVPQSGFDIAANPNTQEPVLDGG